MSRRTLHQPVLLTETLELLGAMPGQLVVDGTLGDGGHAEAVLEQTGPAGRLIGLDRDAEALAEARLRLARFGDRVELVQASFRTLPRLLHTRHLAGVDALLLDLGVSSHQLDAPERGFRFAEARAAQTPLDMRMDSEQGLSARDLLAQASGAELEEWFRSYGELPGAGKLARAIVETRRRTPLRTAADLLAVVHAARVGGGRRHHPGTLVFQALRIAVNDELGALEEILGSLDEVLLPGGRVCVIAYHSLEDRLVKRRLLALERGCVCPPRQPVCTCGRKPSLRRLTRRPLRPDPEEVRRNPRARSARLRAALRLPVAA